MAENIRIRDYNFSLGNPFIKLLSERPCSALHGFRLIVSLKKLIAFKNSFLTHGLNDTAESDLAVFRCAVYIRFEAKRGAFDCDHFLSTLIPMKRSLDFSNCDKIALEQCANIPLVHQLAVGTCAKFLTL